MSTPAEVSLTVRGHPAPKGSRTIGTRGNGTHFTRPASNREHRWVEAVARQAQWVASQVEPPSPPYFVEMVFYMPKPARPAYSYPVKGDIDKLVRAVADGLTLGGLLVDDKHITGLVASKCWAATPDGECVRVTVSTAALQAVA